MWRHDIVQTANFLLQELGKTLPNIVSILFRFGLLCLFFWYFLAFISELWSANHPTLLVALIAIVILATLLCGWTLVRACGALNLHARAESARLASFLFLNLPWLAVVAIATWYGHNFGGGLLHFTQFVLKKMLGNV
jgi:hypothetical protein